MGEIHSDETERFFYLYCCVLTCSFTCLQQEDEEEEPAKQVKSLFNVRMVKYDESKKVAVIKEVKNLVSGMNLVQVSIELYFVLSPVI